MASGSAGSGSLRVRWLPSARKAYSRSIVYIAEQDRRAADLVAERVEKALDMIALQPGMGTPVSRLGRRRFPMPAGGAASIMTVMGSKSNKQAEAFAALTAQDRARLNKLAILAGLTGEELWPAVYRYGFQDIEESVQASLDADEDIAAGRTIPHEEVMAEARRILAAHAKPKRKPD